VRRFVAVAVAAMLLLFGGALAVIFLATSPGPSAGGAPPPVEAPAEASAPPDVRGPPPSPASATTLAPAAPPPPGDDWSQARQLQLPHGTVARELLPPLDPCMAHPGEGSGRRATIQLRLEAVAGGLEVVDALPAGGDPDMDRAVSCAQEILRGRKVSFPGLPAGERFQATFVLPESAPPPPGSAPPRSADSAPARPFRRQRGK